MSLQHVIPCVLMRGGTSKGAYFHEHDLPPAGAERDALLIRIMGSPDLLQIDGLGGSRPITSKIAIIAPSSRADCDVDYLFAQVDIETATIDYRGNCGNISAGVGPFAIDEGLVAACEPVTQVRIHNVNTGKPFTARVEVDQGKARTTGAFSIPGVPGTGSEILLDYTQTIGAMSGKLLPTGNAVDTLQLDDGREVVLTLCDAGNPVVWIAASSLDLSGSELADEIEGNARLLADLAEIRGRMAQRLGLCRNWEDAAKQSPALPLIGFVARPEAYETSHGETIDFDQIDIRARLIFMGRMHESMAGTASISLAAATRISGSTPFAKCRATGEDQLRIGHPLGSMAVTVRAKSDGRGEFDAIGFGRTARRIFAGQVYVPVEDVP